MHDFAFKLLHALDVGPFEVVQDTCSMEEHMTSVLEKTSSAIRVCLLQLDQPFSGLLLPITPDDLGIEGHVLSQAPYFADLVKILPDIRRVREEARPVGL
jgi:hypothetical protein